MHYAGEQNLQSVFVYLSSPGDDDDDDDDDDDEKEFCKMALNAFCNAVE